MGTHDQCLEGPLGRGFLSFFCLLFFGLVLFWLGTVGHVWFILAAARGFLKCGSKSDLAINEIKLLFSLQSKTCAIAGIRIVKH